MELSAYEHTQMELQPTAEKFAEQVVQTRKDVLNSVLSFEIPKGLSFEGMIRLHRITSPGKPESVVFGIGENQIPLHELKKRWEETADDLPDDDPNISLERYLLNNGIKIVVSYDSDVIYDTFTKQESLTNQVKIKMLFLNKEDALQYLDQAGIARNPDRSNDDYEFGRYNRKDHRNNGDYFLKGEFVKRGNPASCWSLEFSPKEFGMANDFFEPEISVEDEAKKEMERLVGGFLEVLKQNSRSLLESEYFEVINEHIADDVAKCFERLSESEKQMIISNTRRSVFNEIKKRAPINQWPKREGYERMFNSITVSRGADYPAIWKPGSRTEYGAIANGEYNQQMYGALVRKFPDDSEEYDEVYTAGRLFFHYGAKIRLLSRVLEEDFDHPDSDSVFLPLDVRRNVGLSFYDAISSGADGFSAFRETRTDDRIHLSIEDIEEVCIPNNAPNANEIAAELKKLGYPNVKIVEASRLRKFRNQ